MIRVQAPSNIALVKYMGKTDPKVNLPANDSLSLTLGGLHTQVDMAPSADWEARGLGDERALSFLRLLSDELPPMLEGLGLRSKPTPVSFESGNTFPAGAGVASSASAFAALTSAYALTICPELKERWGELGVRKALARLSRRGSGSSCRSFMGPFVRWSGEGVEEVASPLELCDLVVLVDQGQKAVGSSQAHLRVTSSPLWEGRVERAQARCDRVQAALEKGAFGELCSEVWAEAWEMHSLFHTSAPPFTYWKPGTLDVLEFLRPLAEGGRAAVTMDAGPNVHVLVPKEEEQEWKSKLQNQFPHFQVLSDGSSPGPVWVQP